MRIILYGRVVHVEQTPCTDYCCFYCFNVWFILRGKIRNFDLTRSSWAAQIFRLNVFLNSYVTWFLISHDLLHFLKRNFQGHYFCCCTSWRKIISLQFCHVDEEVEKANQHCDYRLQLYSKLKKIAGFRMCKFQN